MSGGVLVTGGAGFIGSHVVDALLARGEVVTVLDDFNDFYHPSWKWRNLVRALQNERFHLVDGDIRDPEAVARAFARVSIDRVLHLAARAGVQPSIQNPVLYWDVNLVGTGVLLAACARAGVERIVAASSSSVYGIHTQGAFSEADPADSPISPYAATKRAMELQCHAFHHLTGVPVTCFRPFTAYGPRNRPDMAVYRFAEAILAGTDIVLHGTGTRRDFTYVEDIAGGILAALDHPQGFLVCNLGRGNPVSVEGLLGELEGALGRPARIVRRPLPPGDVPVTWASVERARHLLGWAPAVSLRDGLRQFAAWFVESRACRIPA